MYIANNDNHSRLCGCTDWSGSLFTYINILVISLCIHRYTLQKHAYSNILKISLPKTESFHIKILKFSYFCSKHRLWVLIRTALQRQF